MAGTDGSPLVRSGSRCSWPHGHLRQARGPGRRLGPWPPWLRTGGPPPPASPGSSTPPASGVTRSTSSRRGSSWCCPASASLRPAISFEALRVTSSTSSGREAQLRPGGNFRRCCSSASGRRAGSGWASSWSEPALPHSASSDSLGDCKNPRLGRCSSAPAEHLHVERHLPTRPRGMSCAHQSIKRAFRSRQATARLSLPAPLAGGRVWTPASSRTRRCVLGPRRRHSPREVRTADGADPARPAGASLLRPDVHQSRARPAARGADAVSVAT